MFFTERHHSDRSALGLTGSYETGRIDQAEVRTKCANSILVRPRKYVEALPQRTRGDPVCDPRSVDSQAGLKTRLVKPKAEEDNQ